MAPGPGGRRPHRLLPAAHLRHRGRVLGDADVRAQRPQQPGVRLRPARQRGPAAAVPRHAVPARRLRHARHQLAGQRPRQRRRPGRPLGRRPQDLHLAHGGVPRRRAPHHLGQGGQADAGVHQPRAGDRRLQPGARARAPQPAPKDLDWDKDGIQNDVDQCPKLAGDPPDGCPSIDSDNDTFLDKVDKCPFEAGVAPDGCPPPDTDKDGIIDADDQCPTEPWPEAPGCPPPPDADGDKIIDKDDKCPMHPESYNGFEDSDGCPDKLPEKAKEWDKRPLEGINFETRSDKIKKGSEKTLDVAVGVLKEFPSLKIEIQGHTDDVGGRDFNLELSQRRADSVKRYLVEHGIEESRIKTTGFGPDKPIDPAKTSKARAKNRRIEFKVLIDRPEGASSSDDGDAPTAAPATGGE
ncbi:OmpA family protein [Nannocystis pusilla]|uniref:OmpA family protein n=1 Tax=Nannocystis pusilla TaxID=889268 RepID=UPI003B80F534